jgi:hypothetical protein
VPGVTFPYVSGTSHDDEGDDDDDCSGFNGGVPGKTFPYVSGTSDHDDDDDEGDDDCSGFNGGVPGVKIFMNVRVNCACSMFFQYANFKALYHKVQH